MSLNRVNIPSLCFVLALPLLVAGSCDKSISSGEFSAREWSRACASDSDCVLVTAPCSHCGGGDVPIAASARADYLELAGTVSCDDYDYSDECGGSMDMRARCSEGGTCIAEIAQ